jgi:hypothetical protein
MRRYLAGSFAAVLATALLAAPAQAQTPSPSPTHAEYVDEVSPICKDGAGDANRAVRKVRPSGDPIKDFVRAAGAFRKVFARTVRRIAAVDRPAETADDIREWIRGLRQQKRIFDRIILAAKRQDAARSIALGKKSGKVQARTIKRAKRLDLDRCARGAQVR